jgi:hypothetical protein
MDLVRVTAELIEAGCSRHGGWTRRQLGLLGVPWPPQHGWKQAAIGRRICASDANYFLALKDGHLRKSEPGRQPQPQQPANLPGDALLRATRGALVTAGAVWRRCAGKKRHWLCVRAAPILKWMVGLPAGKAKRRLDRDGWNWEWVASPGAPLPAPARPVDRQADRPPYANVAQPGPIPETIVRGRERRRRKGSSGPPPNSK